MTSTSPKLTDTPDLVALTGRHQQWLAICAATLREAPDQLGRLLTADHPYAAAFATGGRRWAATDPLTPEGDDIPDLGAAAAILSVARALADPPRSADLLAPAL